LEWPRHTAADIPGTVRAAFDYASHPDVRNPLDSPEYAQSSPSAGDISLRRAIDG
jgi:hypothetical protein